MEHNPSRVLRIRNSNEQPLSEREIVKATLAFANGARLYIDGLALPSYADGDSDHSLKSVVTFLELEQIKEQGRERSEAEWERYRAVELPKAVEKHREEAREATRSRLVRALRHPDEVADFLVQFAELIKPKPLLRKVPGGLSLSSYYQFSSDLDLVHVGEVLLLDPERGFMQELCHCQLPACGAFFFEKRPPTGRPQRKYCSRAHMLRAHNENASARMAKKRRPRKPR
jgi:hypothetical protein